MPVLEWFVYQPTYSCLPPPIIILFFSVLQVNICRQSLKNTYSYTFNYHMHTFAIIFSIITVQFYLYSNYLYIFSKPMYRFLPHQLLYSVGFLAIFWQSFFSKKRFIFYLQLKTFLSSLLEVVIYLLLVILLSFK